MCPSAEQLLGQLASDARVVPITFHVDYFNDPWKDPFSDPKFSRREMQYSVLYDRANKLNKPNYLYLTPLVMVDGQTPMVGKDDAETKGRAQAAIRRSLADRPSVAIDLALKAEGGEAKRSLDVTLSALVPEMRGREVLVAVVPYSAKTSTRVGSGELAGKTYGGRFVARGFEAQAARIAPSGKATTTFRVAPPKDADLKADGIVVIVQDEETGAVYQAAIISWQAEGAKVRTAAKGARR